MQQLDVLDVVGLQLRDLRRVYLERRHAAAGQLGKVGEGHPHHRWGALFINVDRNPGQFDAELLRVGLFTLRG